MDYIKQFYNTTATHNYIFGVLNNATKRVTVYFVNLDLDGYRVLFNEKPTTAQRQTVIKFRSSKAKVAYLNKRAKRIEDFMSEAELKASRRTKTNRYGKAYQENCGEALEHMIAVKFGGKENTVSNLKHSDGGDIEIDGIQYQVKYEKGAITIKEG